MLLVTDFTGFYFLCHFNMNQHFSPKGVEVTLYVHVLVHKEVLPRSE